MPELPEVETMRRGIAGIVGGEVVRFEKLACPRKPIVLSPRVDRLHARIAGRQVSAVERLGKRVVIVFDTNDRLVIEPRMTGLVLVNDPPDPLYLRWQLAVRQASTRDVWYWDRRGLGVVRLLNDSEFRAKLGSEAIGPDALTITAEQLRGRLSASRRPVKVALLDQQVVAGIGNLYAAEILHVAGIRPTRACARLTRSDWQRVVAATQQVLSEAIAYEGSTLGDGTYRNALNKAGGYQNHHRVYARDQQACPRCSTPITRIVQAQRSTFYCRGCQK